MTAMRQLYPHELTNEDLGERLATEVNKFEQAICKNCRHAIYNGPFIGYEPDLDEASDRHIWRHSRSRYAVCHLSSPDRAEPGGYPVITLCGSAKFMDKFIEMSAALTRQGNVVISLSMVKKNTADQDAKLHELLDDIHKRKIDLSHSIYVLNVGGYIGESTRGEIEYARKTGKRVDYLEPV